MKPEVKIVVGGLLLVVGAGSAIVGDAIQKEHDKKVDVETILMDSRSLSQSMYGIDWE